MILHIAINGHLHKLTLERKQEESQEEGSFLCEVDGERLTGSARLLEPGILSLILGTCSYRCILVPGGDPGGDPAVLINGHRYSFAVEDPRSLKARLMRAESESGPQPIKAPMPGRIVRVLAEEGAEVQAGQGVLVIEAMKMQNELKAPKAGRVTELSTAPGAAVNAGQVLAIIG